MNEGYSGKLAEKFWLFLKNFEPNQQILFRLLSYHGSRFILFGMRPNPDEFYSAM